MSYKIKAKPDKRKKPKEKVGEVAHKPLPVSGYTAQQQAAIDLVNFHKRMEEIVLRHLDRLRDSGDLLDQRDVSIAKTHIEDAFMRMNRAVFKPQRIALPEDK